MLGRKYVGGVKRHRHGPDEEVADGQRGDEVVGRLADGPLEKERYDDDQVTPDRDQTEAAPGQTENYRLPGCEGLRLAGVVVIVEFGRPELHETEAEVVARVTTAHVLVVWNKRQARDRGNPWRQILPEGE